MTASRAGCRAALARIVAASLAGAEELARHLADERQALEAQNGDALGVAAEAKRACVEKLERLEEERRAAALTAKQSIAPRAMPTILSWCRADSATIAAWEHFLTLAADCKHSNTTNGAIIHLRRRHFAAALAIVTGAHHEAPALYGPSGQQGTRAASKALAEI